MSPAWGGAAGLLVLVALAGCGAPTPAVHVPTGQPIAIEAQEFPLRAADSFGCGFCVPGEGPWFTAILLGQAGEVVVIEYDRGQGAPNAPTYGPGPAAWAVLLDGVFAGSTLYGERTDGTDDDRPVHVVSILAYQMQPEDQRAVAMVVRSALAGARSPQSEGVVTDCGRTIVEAFGEHAGRAEIHCDHDEGGGWGRLHEQMVVLRQWASRTPSI